ncbi:tyrosinase family protein [Sagittula salina]|uniref:Tyrosinase family protein n=1 Tax=Sagittula salina TaxID=2820268 RepID=A0A940RZX5_9RHOB|nr:tyrosinase family protein [Sagittula salina]MBP0481457.1 tyrosinase family protein [Sagittula salina]
MTATVVPLGQWVRQARAADYMLTRYNANSPEGRDMLGIYAHGVGLMKQRPSSDPLSWDFQYYTHWMQQPKAQAIDDIYGPDPSPEKMAAEAMWNTCRGHIAWASQADWFVPWHRMYVLYLERIVRRVTGEDSFTLPYWNYTNPQTVTIPEAFRDPDSPLFVADRNPGINEGTLGMDGLSTGFMGRENYAGITGFNRTLDNNPHGQVHVQVGTPTNMGSVPTAAKDPVFWVHHAQVDRCWASWNAAGGANPTEDAWTGRTFQFFDAVENTLVTVPTGSVTTTEALGYNYQDLIQPMPPATEMVSADKLRETLPMVLAAAEGVPMTESVPGAQGPLKLGTGPATARLDALPILNEEAVTDRPQRTYLVISDLATEVQPGVVYDVYIGGAQVAEAKAEAWKVGQIHFFNAASNLESMAEGNAIFTFDVTDKLDVLTAEAPGMDAPEVTIVPAGQPRAEAQPLVGTIRLMRE